VFEAPDLHAEHVHVEAIVRQLRPGSAIPVAVGSGTINDLAKLAAHICDRPYACVATAASMDGYTAFGASITRNGSKETFHCPAPAAVIADMEVIANAPAGLNAAGYADLAAKITAGADWILADALDIEPVVPQGWAIVQDHLRVGISDPCGIMRGEHPAIRALVEGLLMTGFAMQQCKSSRPASGAEHQFSHLWDMQGHHHEGRIPFHGCKVAIGTMAATLAFEFLLEQDLEQLDVRRACAAWPTKHELKQLVANTHDTARLRAVANRECLAKRIDRRALAGRLEALRLSWPGLRKRLAAQIVPFGTLRQMLAAAGAPDSPQQIGIDRARLRRSFVEAQQIRRRYTVLDVLNETGLMTPFLDRLFSGTGPWDTSAEKPAENAQ
jgi:glycerol-1-phosphate dehydrogenase [NAD(P)+]